MRRIDLKSASNEPPAQDFVELVNLALEGGRSSWRRFEGNRTLSGSRDCKSDAGSGAGSGYRRWSNCGRMGFIIEDLKAAVETSLCRGFPLKPIIASTLGDEPTVMGAISLVLASKFASVSFA